MKKTMARIKKQIAQESNKMAACRDRLMLLVEEAQDLVDDVDMAHEDIECGLDHFQSAIDKLSEKQ